MDAGSTRVQRILYVITKANWGGSQKYVYELATAMAACGIEVLVAYGEQGLLATRLTEAGIRTRHVPSLCRDFNWKSEWETLRTLVSLMKEERPDIVHVNGSKGGLALVAARIARIARIIFTAHGWAFNEDRPLWQRMLMHGVYALTVLLSHTTICVSRAVRNDLAWFPDFLRRFVVVYNGIDVPTFLSREEAREKLGIVRMDVTVLGMIAELHPTKRVEDAIRALSELSGLAPEPILVLLGDGEQKQWLKDYAAHYGLADRVVFKGFVPDAAHYLLAFDIFLMTSRSEALALALVEAGYAGLPVIATRTGGIPEVVSHKRTGLLVPRQNPHALARAIRTLLEHPEEARAYASALKNAVASRFSKERMVSETAAVYGLTYP